MDTQVLIFDQLGKDLAPVILINVFTGDAADLPAHLKAWENDANWMKRQAGYISTQLHRGIAGNCVFLNVCGVGIGGALPRGPHASGLSRRARRLPITRGGFAALVQQGGNPQPLRGMTEPRSATQTGVLHLLND